MAPKYASPKLTLQSGQQEQLLIMNSAPIDEPQKDPETMRVSSTRTNSSQTSPLGTNHVARLRYPLSRYQSYRSFCSHDGFIPGQNLVGLLLLAWPSLQVFNHFP